MIGTSGKCHRTSEKLQNATLNSVSSCTQSGKAVKRSATPNSGHTPALVARPQNIEVQRTRQASRQKRSVIKPLAFLRSATLNMWWTLQFRSHHRFGDWVSFWRRESTTTREEGGGKHRHTKEDEEEGIASSMEEARKEALPKWKVKATTPKRKRDKVAKHKG